MITSSKKSIVALCMGSDTDNGCAQGLQTWVLAAAVVPKDHTALIHRVFLLPLFSFPHLLLWCVVQIAMSDVLSDGCGWNAVGQKSYP